MSVKDGVLSLLLESNGEVVSGQDIADRLSCSRMAVSKSVQSLMAEGYDIRASKHYGYSLVSSDVLSDAVLKKAFSIPVYYTPECRSTFFESRSLITAGAEVPFALVAGQQNGGKGRLGRSFFSPIGGVYLSVVLKGHDIPNPDLLTVSASIATADAIEKLTGAECAIKWVNDIYSSGRKVVGILTEGIVNMELGGLDEAIVGIGINLSGNEEDIPEDLRGKMGFLFPSGKAPVSRAELAAAVTDNLIAMQNRDFMDEYRRRCFIIGRDVTVIKPGKGEWPAKAFGVDDSGHLLVRYDDGREEALSSGEVTLRI